MSFRRGAVLLGALAATLAFAPGASAGPSPVDDLLSRCPTADEVAAIAAQVPITFDTDPTAPTFVCTAASGSADLSRLQERAYQAVLTMQSMHFRQALPWTSGAELYDWFVHAVHGVRFRNDISNNFCCDPAYVINIKEPSASDLQTSRWVDPSGGWGMKGLVEVMVHEARHAEGPAHTCGTNDTSFGEVGAWTVQYYLNLWEALYSGPFLAAPDPYEAYYRDSGLYADFIAEHMICTAPSSDLSLSIAAPNPIPRGGTLPYAITVANGGPGAAPAVFLYSAIPQGTILSSTLTDGGSCIGPAGGTNGSVGCSLGAIPAGGAIHVQLIFRVTAPATQVYVSNRDWPFAVGTHVSGTVHDPYSNNNSVSVMTTLVDALAAAETRDATAVGETTATVTGAVNPNGTDATYRFEYGTTTGYGSQTPVRNAGSGTADQPVTEALTGLRPGTRYHYRLAATNVSGTSFGSDATFRTTIPCVVPSVKGETVAAAKRAIRRAHCVAGRVRHTHSRVRRGRVISQRPKPGTHLREGGAVRLVVSLGRRHR